MAAVMITRIRAKAGFERQLERAIRAMIAKLREEGQADTPRYALYRGAEDPAVLILWERHTAPPPEFESNGGSALTDALVGLIDGRPMLETFIEVDAN